MTRHFNKVTATKSPGAISNTRTLKMLFHFKKMGRKRYDNAKEVVNDHHQSPGYRRSPPQKSDPVNLPNPIQKQSTTFLTKKS